MSIVENGEKAEAMRNAVVLLFFLTLPPFFEVHLLSETLFCREPSQTGPLLCVPIDGWSCSCKTRITLDATFCNLCVQFLYRICHPKSVCVSWLPVGDYRIGLEVTA